MALKMPDPELPTLPPFESTRRRGIPWSADLANESSLVISPPHKKKKQKSDKLTICTAVPTLTHQVPQMSHSSKRPRKVWVMVPLMQPTLAIA